MRDVPSKPDVDCANACVCSADVPRQMRVTMRSNEMPATSRLLHSSVTCQQECDVANKIRGTHDVGNAVVSV